MVRRAIASAVAVMALLGIGWAAGNALGDPLPSRHKPPMLPVPYNLCHHSPTLETLPMASVAYDIRQLHAAEVRRQEQQIRAQLLIRTSELSSCAALYAEPGAEQHARVIVGGDGNVGAVEVQGPMVSEALQLCVQKRAFKWSFPPGSAEFVLTLPVQDCPGS